MQIIESGWEVDCSICKGATVLKMKCPFDEGNWNIHCRGIAHMDAGESKLNYEQCIELGFVK